MEVLERFVLNFHISFNSPASPVSQIAETTNTKHVFGAATPSFVREHILDQSKK